MLYLAPLSDSDEEEEEKVRIAEVVTDVMPRVGTVSEEKGGNKDDTDEW